MLTSRSTSSRSLPSLRAAARKTAVIRSVQVPIASSSLTSLSSYSTTTITGTARCSRKESHAWDGLGKRTFASIIEGEGSTPKRKPLFDKILIANRGEIACRVIRTAKKLGVKTVAVYSEVDSHSLHVQMADEAYCIGPAPSAESYLRMDKIIEVAQKSGAQAIHPGYGFLSENATFAQRLSDEGIVFIGPTAASIRSMGSKSESKDIMTLAGVPCVPGYHGSDQSPSRLLGEAEQIGFPVLIKAIMGGGGKGMRIVHSASEFPDALESARREARKSFGDERVLVEKYIVRPRHVEVQVFGDQKGNVVSLWERDCSVQRRHQKIIEEAPAPGLSEELRADLCEKAVAAAKAVDYVGAGTVEFIFDNDTTDFYFMEMNTRLQVEHPVTEMITSQDLVEWQLEVAAGNPLPLKQTEIPRIGHAFEARIYAENPRNNFLPDVGPLLHLSTPAPSASVRIEEGFLQGSKIEVYYDPLISKLIAHGRDRAEALRVLRKALEEYQVVGVSTNIEFLRTLAGNDQFISGEVETGFIQKHHDQLFPPPSKPPAEVIAQAGLYVALRDQSPKSYSPWSNLGPRRIGGDVHERVITLLTDSGSESSSVTVHIKTVGPGLYDLTIQTDDSSHEFRNVSSKLASSAMIVSTIDSSLMRTTIVSQSTTSLSHPGEQIHVFHDGRKVTLTLPAPRWLQEATGEVQDSSKFTLRSPMPSLVVDVRVKVGDKVEKGQGLVVLESMKTETLMRSDISGVVVSVGAHRGEMVKEGQELVVVEAVEASELAG